MLADVLQELSHFFFCATLLAMTTLQILSDLHLESPKGYDIFEIAPCAPYLALLGDVGNVVEHEAEFLTFLTAQLRQFRAVLFVPGNHEAYNSSWPKTLSILRAFEQSVSTDSMLGTFILLDRAVFRLPDTSVAVLGCSLFSYVPAESQAAVGTGLNDFFLTDGWDVAVHNAAHARDVAWLNAQVAELEEVGIDAVAILTHWSPTQDARSAEPRHATSQITSGFSTDLSGEQCFKSRVVTVWAFGHTHYNCDFTVQREDGAGPLRLVTNQRGYYFAQAERFDGAKTVDVRAQNLSPMV